MRFSNNINQLDINEWSDFITNHSNGNIFQTPEMYRVYEKTENYEPFVFSVFHGKKLRGVLLAVVQKEYKGFLGKLTSRSIIWGGPIISNKIESPQISLAFFQYYTNVMKKKALYTQIRNIDNFSMYKKPSSLVGFEYEPHLNYILDLTKGEDNIWKDMNKKRRNTIKKSIKSGVKIIELGNEKSLEESYKILQGTYRKVGLPLSDISLFRNAYNILSSKNRAICFNAEYEGRIIATLWILMYNDTMYDWYAGSKTDYLDKCPNDLLIWHSIKWGIDRGYSVFDFGGAGKPDDNYGVRDFKKKFGGQEVNFGRYELIHRPMVFNAVITLFNLKKRLHL